MAKGKITALKAELSIEKDAPRVRIEGLGAYLLTKKKGTPGMTHTAVRFSGKDIMNAVFHMLGRIKGDKVNSVVAAHITVARKELSDAIALANQGKSV